MKTYSGLKTLFINANKQFLIDDADLFATGVSERTLCGALMLHINCLMKKDEELNGYYADVEYNRNRGNVKTLKKTIHGVEEQIIRINCDLIVHSRGKCIEQDNLIAIEMKKSNTPIEAKEKDKDRLKALTKDSFDDIWSFDGTTLPKYVCRYILGIYYEINYRTKQILIEYYRQGELFEQEIINF